MMENNFPEKLLYYSKIDKYCIDVIMKNTFAITDPTRGFNDPFDCFLEVAFDGLQRENLISQLRGIFIIENFIKKGKTVPMLSEEDLNEIDNYQNQLSRCTEDVLKQKYSAYATKEVRSVLSKHLRIRSFSAQQENKTLNNIMGLRVLVWVISYLFEHAGQDFQPEVLLIA